ncbi:MAG: ABC transporter substrate-binding protein [Bryobacteraceae bacterium]
MRLILLFAAAVTAWAGGSERIVSTAPSVTETLFAMGLGERVVGDTIFCNYPPQAANLPKIGSLLHPDVEAIVALHPDLVVVQNKYRSLPDQLTRLHIKYVEVPTDELQGIFEGARAIGRATDSTQAAEQLIASIQHRFDRVRKQAAGLPKPRVAFIVGHTGNRLEGLIAGAAHSYFSDLIEIAGGIDIFADAASPYPRISLEEILSRNPDVILELSGQEKEKQDQVLKLWSEHTSIRAAANHRVYAVPPGPFLIPGPRAAEAAEALFQMLHPKSGS